jgi:PKD repeat protein
MKGEKNNLRRLVIFTIAVTALFVILGFAMSASADTIEVSLPEQVTDNSYYERGQSIIYDGSDYWLFYGRSASCTDSYGTGNPDLHDYEVYYKKASTIAGLETATPVKIPGGNNANVYLGETDSAYYDGYVRAYASVDVGATATLRQWYTNNGGVSWGSSVIETGLPDGAAHFASASCDGKLWFAYKKGGNWESKYWDGSWSSVYTIESSVSGTGKFYCEGTDLYFVRAQGGDQKLHEWGGSSWSQIDSATETGAYDPTIYKVGSDYVFAYAPWDGVKQYIPAKVGTDITTLLSTGSDVMITAGSYTTSNNWVDMWPTGFTDDLGDTYLFYTSERNPDDTNSEIDGNIWYLKVDWDVNNDHFTYIQNAINYATNGDTINIAAGTYHENAHNWVDIDLYKELSLIGAGSTQTIVELNERNNPPGAHMDGISISASNVLLEGMKFTMKPGNNWACGFNIRFGINVHTPPPANTYSNIVLRDIESELSFGSNLVFDGAYTYNNVEIENCNIHHSTTERCLYQSPSTTINDFTVTDSNFDNAGYGNPAVGDPIGFNLQGTTTDLEINGGTFNNNPNGGIGIRRVTNAVIEDVTVINSGYEASGTRSGIGIWEDMSSTSNIEIINPTVSNSGGRGIMFGTWSKTVSDITVTGGTIDTAGNIGLMLYGGGAGGSISNILLDGLTIINSGSHNFMAYQDSGATINNVDILYCDITNSPSTGIYYYGMDVAGSQVNYNNIVGNVDGVFNIGGTGILDAECNWYGHITGPTHSLNPSGIGDTASDNVDYIPWLNDEYPEGECIGNPNQLIKLHPDHGYYYDAEIEMAYLKGSAKITLTGPPNCEIYWRYFYNGDFYPDHLTGDYFYDGEWWYLYDDITGIHFDEDCAHILYYFGKYGDIHGLIHAQSYLVDASPPELFKEHPDHGYMSLDEGIGYLKCCAPINIYAEDRPTPPDESADVVLCLDRSGSMRYGQKLVNLKAAAHHFVNAILAVPGNTRIAIVSFASAATVDQGFTTNAVLLHNAINNLNAAGMTNAEDGLLKSNNLLSMSTADIKVIKFISDGAPTVSNSGGGAIPDALAEAANSAAMGIEIHSIGYGIGSPSTAETFMQNLASITGGQYHHAPTGALLDAIVMAEVGDILGCTSGVENIFWRYEYDGTSYPEPGEPGSIEGATLAADYDYTDPNIIDYCWYYNVTPASVEIHFEEECIHELYYWAKDNVCNRGEIHHQTYLVDCTPPTITKTHPDPCYIPINATAGWIKTGLDINLNAVDVGTPPCEAGVENIFWRYEYDGDFYPDSWGGPHSGTITGAQLNSAYGYSDPEIIDYIWYYGPDNVDVSFTELGRHDLYYWAKDNVCNRGEVHHQIYWVNDCHDIVYIDDDYHSSTDGWWIDHFYSIQNALEWLDVGGTAYIYPSIYNEDVIVDDIPCCDNTGITIEGVHYPSSGSFDHSFEEGCPPIPMYDSAIIDGSITIRVPGVTINNLVFEATTTGAIIVEGNTGIELRCNAFLMRCDPDSIGIDAWEGSEIDAEYNFWGEKTGPNGGLMDDGSISDGWGVMIIGDGSVWVEPWVGIHAEASASSYSVETGEVVIFSGDGSFYGEFGGVVGEPDQYYWTFEPTMHSIQKNPTYVFDNEGTYQVSLRVRGNGIEDYHPGFMYDWDYITIEVTNPGAPLAANADGGNLNGYETIVGEPITLQGRASGGTPPYSYEWNLGDGTTSTLQNPTHTYQNEGTYTVTLYVSDDIGNTVSDTSTVKVYSLDEFVVSISNSYNGIAGTPVLFTCTVSGGKTPYSYDWNFGDGSTSTDAHPTHAYENEGTYTVTATVSDSQNNVETVTSTVYIDAAEEDIVEIKEVKGGMGVQATIKAGDMPVGWSINIDGLIFIGGENSGTIQKNTEETVEIPFTIGFGKVDITITANNIQKTYTAFALGPIFLNLH